MSFLDAKSIRMEILRRLPAYECPGPEHASTVYVWPTRFCPVGCGHCNFASRSEKYPEELQDRAITNHASLLIEFVNSIGVWKAVLSGGGEPLTEIGFVETFVSGIKSTQLREIEIITSGFWGASLKKAEEIIQKLNTAFLSRKDWRRLRFRIRLSVDWFHAQMIGLSPVANIVRLLMRPNRPSIDVHIRSVMLENDDSVECLANILQGHLEPINNYRRWLVLPNGNRILVYYKNLVIDGRMTREKLSRLPLRLAPEGTEAQFSVRSRNGLGLNIPARTYDGPWVKHLKGLALIVESDGSVKILEGNAPDRIPSIFRYDWKGMLEYFYRDPLTIYLLEQGPEKLVNLLARYRPNASMVSSQTNQLYYVIDKVLANNEDLLLATFLVVCHHVSTSRLRCDLNVLGIARDWLETKGIILAKAPLP